MTISRGGIQRAMAGVTIGHIRNMEKRRKMLGFDQLGEIENQFQIPIQGTAAAEIAWGTIDIDFDVNFVMAPEQRDSALTMPHMVYGVYLYHVDPGYGDDTAVGVVVQAAVREWNTEADTGVVTGAKVIIGVSGSAVYAATYKGFVHLSFQGFGAPVETSPDDLDVGA